METKAKKYLIEESETDLLQGDPGFVIKHGLLLVFVVILTFGFGLHFIKYPLAIDLSSAQADVHEKPKLIVYTLPNDVADKIKVGDSFLGELSWEKTNKNVSGIVSEIRKSVYQENTVIIQLDRGGMNDGKLVKAYVLVENVSFVDRIIEGLTNKSPYKAFKE